MKFQIFILALITLLSLRFFFFYHNQNQYKDKEKVGFTLTLTSDPQIVGSQQRISANLGTGERILVITSLIPEFHYGDRLSVSGTINVRVIKDKVVLNTIYFPKIEAIKKDPGLAVISSIRQKIIAMFSKSLPNPSSSLLLGIVFGIKEPMPKDFKDNLRTSGVLHVIAASGMNVTLIGGFISSFFAYFLKRQLALVISIVGIIFYAVLAGLEPSIIRASIMGILVFSSQILGRQNMARNGLIMAGFMMLFISPSLIVDVGFQLSFFATAGLLYIRPLFEQNLKLKAILQRSFIGSDVITTIAAQLATLPILLANFGTYSLWSILVNGLVLWTIPSLMVIGGVSGLAGLIFMPLGNILIYLCYPFLFYFEKIVNVFGQIEDRIIIQELSWSIIIGYYLILSSIVLFFGRKAMHNI
ncbi:ComEC/Rec2 family competence protein [Candidatus Roizmanbacteria bacterium]|nr:ComEC/Rec2 family competence protein [Candidatus Roizmanbacteria bacterium]